MLARSTQFLLGLAVCLLWYLVSFEGYSWYSGQTRGERLEDYQYCVLKTVKTYVNELDAYIESNRSSVWSLSGILARYAAASAVSMTTC